MGDQHEAQPMSVEKCSMCGAGTDPEWGHGAVDCFNQFLSTIAALRRENEALREVVKDTFRTIAANSCENNGVAGCHAKFIATRALAAIEGTRS